MLFTWFHVASVPLRLFHARVSWSVIATIVSDTFSTPALFSVLNQMKPHSSSAQQQASAPSSKSATAAFREHGLLTKHFIRLVTWSSSFPPVVKVRGRAERREGRKKKKGNTAVKHSRGVKWVSHLHF